MNSVTRDRFLRISNMLIEALMRARLSGAQWRVLLWVIRQTHGWNRRSTAFTWYQLAKDIALDRATTYRAGQGLIRAGIVILADGELEIQEDSQYWGNGVLNTRHVDHGQLWIPGLNVVRMQRQPLSGRNGSVVRTQRLRCLETTLFRRAKDTIKDNIKTYKYRHRHSRRSPNVRRPRDYPPAGAAEPVPGKYDGLSQN
jgi:phage replication O-like protein O